MSGFRHFFQFNLVLPVADLYMHTSTRKWYSRIKSMNGWSGEEIAEWQARKLNKLLIHFYRNTVYYKKLFRDYDINPETTYSIKDLDSVPPLTKSLIRENYNDMLPSNISGIRYKNAATGGSTGDPLRYPLDLESWSYTTASNIYSFSRMGLLYGEKYVALGSSSLFPSDRVSLRHKIYYSLRNKIPLNGMNMSAEILEKYIRFFRKEKIRFIYGYASALYLLAKYVNENKEDIKLEGCFSTSEVLTDEYRSEIESAFGCLVYDGYGARDGGITADELTRGFMHVGYNSIAEIIDPFRENTGKLLVTDLLNYAFPFIRYDIGDDVCLPDNNPDVYNGQLISRVYGRESNVIRLENGHVLTGPGFTILFKDLNVIAYKIFKSGKLEVKVQVQPSPDFTRDEENLIHDTLKKHAGEECRIIVELVDRFEPDKSGKFSYFMK